jgi:hypothetical protein
MKCTLECNADQLRLIQRALDFYSRIGIGQFKEIVDHPTFENHLYKECTPNKIPEVGDMTPQGGILEIKNGKAYIYGSVDKKEGIWSNKPEWKKLEDVKLSTDYVKYHHIRSMTESLLTEARNFLTQDNSIGKNGSWGIHNDKVDESCREAFNMIQVIRHEFWKLNDKRSSATVDSSIDERIKDKISIKIE